MAAKIISQRKWAKLVASTGSLSQPPGALPRMSNLLMTQRGSLQVADGSASLGQVSTLFTRPLCISPFIKYSSAQYPIYSILSATPSPWLSDFPASSFIAAPSGSSTNPAGAYCFVLVALGSQGGLSVNNTPIQAQFTTAGAFATVNFQWPVVANATGYDVYYLASPIAIQGSKILSNVAGTLSGGNLIASFTGALSSGTTTFPNTNSSTLVQLFFGNIVPPSTSLVFTPCSVAPFPGLAVGPMQIAPGDPRFVLTPVSAAVSSTVAPAVSSGEVDASVSYGSPPQSATGVIASGWASATPPAGQPYVVTFSETVDVSIALIDYKSYGEAKISYAYSNGSTTVTFKTTTLYASASYTDNVQATIPAGFLSNLNALTFTATVRVSAAGSPSAFATASTDCTFSGLSGGGATSYASPTPYGGISGLVCNIPTMVQFAGYEILVLGNGYAPQSCDPSQLAAATLTPLANTFQDAFPDWQSSVTWLTSAQVTDGAGNYYTATQGGVSGTSAPSWNTALGAQTADGTVQWTSQGPIVASTAPRGAAHAVAYAGSLWLANTSPANTSDGIDGPSCLKMSDVNNPNSWNPVNTAFVGRQDGTQITGICPFTIAALGISPTGSLCIFKEFTTYQFIGVFGTTSFEIQPAQTNLGCIAARSIQFLPGFGVVRFTHLGFAVFDGINDRLISEDIRPYLFGGVDSEADLTPVDPTYCYLSQSAQTIAPPTYLCAMPLSGQSGALTRLFCYDLVMKSWAVLDLPWAISSMATVASGEGYPLVLAGKSDGTIQRLQSGDLNWDQGATDQSAVQWSFRTPDLFGEGGTQRLFYERATITGYGSATMVQSIIANLWLDGQQIGSQAIDIVPQGGSNLFTANVSIFRNGNRAHLDISGNSGGATGVIDSVDWAVTPKSNMARRVIS